MIDTISGFFEDIDTDRGNNPLELQPLSDAKSSSYTQEYRGDRMGRFRVFKCLKPEYRDNPAFESLLRKEFEIGYSLKHPHICEFYSFTTIPGYGHCIEMEWIDGCTLEELSKTGALKDKDLCRKIISEICDTLSYLNSRHIIHRDLKPSNILVSHKGHNVSIIDFGLSDTDYHSVLKAPAGTRFYAAPELISNDNPDNRSDIYSLGRTVLSTMEHYRRVGKKCCREDRSKRYQNAEEIMRDLDRKNPLPFFLAAAVLLAAGIWIWSRPKAPDIPEERTSPDTAAVAPALPAAPEIVSETKPTTKMDKKAKTIQEEDAVDVDTIDSLFRKATELFE